MSVAAEIIKLKQEVSKLLDSFNNKMMKEISKPDIYLRYLKERVNYLIWTSRKYTLFSEGDPESISQRDVFYCEFGYNIGSEQKEKRPAVILQNNRGNNSSRTTIIAPVSTHQNCIFFEDRGKKFITFIDDNGQKTTKKLDYYEIPILLEVEFGERIKGYINLAQIKTVSKKRLSKRPVAKITTDNFLDIQKSMNKLLELT